MIRSRSALLLLAVLLAAPLRAQEPQRAAETQALQAAGALEGSGQLSEAEAVLRTLLDAQPASVGGLFALERVLRAQGRTVDMLPVTGRLLAIDGMAPGVRLLRLRVLADVDSLDALVRETRAWIELAPADPVPYREAAPLWERALGPERALELLGQGRRAIGEPTVLALEMGDVLVRAGRPVDAVGEWTRVAVPGEGGEGILRRVAQIDEPSERARMVDEIMAALERPPTTAPRRMLAVRLGFYFERVDQAFEAAHTLAPELSAATRRGFLEEVTSWADDVGAQKVTLWALTQLRDVVENAAAARAIDLRIARSALVAGDTLMALTAGRRLAEGLPMGSAERQRVLADQIRVEAATADPASLLAGLDEFRAEFPDAPERDELAALAASALQARGEAARAADVLADVQGPRSALERGYLLLAAGDVLAGRAALLEAVPGMVPARATETIQLASLLGRLSESGARVVARAAVQAHRGSARQAALTLEDAVPALPPADRPVVLAGAARLAAGAAADADAARIQEALIEGYPDAAEAEEAALALARWHARIPEGIATAIRLLEDLIVRASSSAVAPDARRELERLRRGA